MDPLTIIAIASLFAATAELLYVLYLILDDLLNWFRDTSKVRVSWKDDLWFDTIDKLENGNYRVIQGIIDPRTEELVKGRVIQSKKIDKRLEDAHRGKEIVIWD
jgi:hypothetical protein